jgi:hypothetical protein
MYQLASMLGMSVPGAIGSLHLLWYFALDHAEDGDLSDVHEGQLKRELHFDGSASELRSALIETGFLDEDGKIHNWNRYAGRLMSERERRRRWREGKEKPDASEAPSGAKPQKRGIALEAFEEFWAAYPKKSGKGAAEKSYFRALKLTDSETVLKAVNKQKSWRAWREGFVPNPATWLNQRRWEDVEAESPTGATEGGGVWAKKS